MKNYHTHTKRCHHAGNAEDEAYVLAAIEAGYETLGFSDHSPWPFSDGYVSDNERMTVDELPGYLASVRMLKEKYSDRIRIECGLECEYYPQYYGWLEGVRKELDYVILGEHFAVHDEHGEHYYANREITIERIEEYTGFTITAMKTGIFSYLAHPDLPLANYPDMDKKAEDCMAAIITEAKKLDLPLEYNLYGVDKIERGIFAGKGYPAPKFWQLAADLGATAIIGVDAHRPENLLRADRFHAAEDFLRSTGITLIGERP